jgi:hypothetical protein
MKHLKTFNESQNNIWDIAHENTKTKAYQTQLGKSYVRTCKKCDDIVENSPTRERQMIGNVYQTVTVCDVCNTPFILDEHQDYEWFLVNKDNLESA